VLERNLSGSRSRQVKAEKNKGIFSTFLPKIPVILRWMAPDHYHVPLLLSPMLLHLSRQLAGLFGRSTQAVSACNHIVRAGFPSRPMPNFQGVGGEAAEGQAGGSGPVRRTLSTGHLVVERLNTC